ncbi:MAG: peptidase M48 [Hyphomicrobium sp.]
MKRFSAVALGGLFVTGAMFALAPVPAMAGATAAFELEHARANARAGGPISEYDAELLERWGNSSGGPDWRKQYRAQQGYYDDAPVQRRYKKHRRVYRD